MIGAIGADGKTNAHTDLNPRVVQRDLLALDRQMVEGSWMSPLSGQPGRTFGQNVAKAFTFSDQLKQPEH